MSKKVIPMPKPKPKTQTLNLNHPVLEQVSKEQKDYINNYGKQLGPLLMKLWQKFGKGPFEVNQAAVLEDQLVNDVDKYIMTKFAGTLSLQEYIVVLGSLAGLQAGYSELKGNSLTTQIYHEAGQLFESSMRIMSVSYLQQFKNARPAAKPPVPPQRKH